MLILQQHALQGPAPLVHVPLDPAAQPHVRIGVHKDPDIHQVPQRLVLEDQDAFHNDDLPGDDADGLVAAVVLGKVVDRAVDGFATAELVQMEGHQVRFQGIGLIVVELAALLVGHVVVALVVVVVAENRHLSLKALDQVLHKGRFAAAGAAGNANDKNVVLHSQPPWMFFLL